MESKNLRFLVTYAVILVPRSFDALHLLRMTGAVQERMDVQMKNRLLTAIEIFFESLYFLVITYTLSSMAASFNPDLFGLLCRVANIYAFTRFYESVRKHTESHFWTYVVMFLNLAAFALLACKVGYIKGEFTPFPRYY